jgi:CubicO group peptidase (beta-lactamase class C family)
MPFQTFLQERIFDPLGMTDTGFWLPEEKENRLATIYQWKDPETGLQALTEIKPPKEMPSFVSGGGGLWSTIQDYARFAQMLVNRGSLGNQQLLSPTTMELFTINQCPEEALPYGFFENDLDQAGYGYSLGTKVLMDVGESGKAGSVGEFGWGGKFKTFFWIDPVKELYGLLMVQLDTEEENEVSNQFRQLTYQALIE